MDLNKEYISALSTIETAQAEGKSVAHVKLNLRVKTLNRLAEMGYGKRAYFKRNNKPLFIFYL